MASDLVFQPRRLNFGGGFGDREVRGWIGELATIRWRIGKRRYQASDEPPQDILRLGDKIDRRGEPPQPPERDGEWWHTGESSGGLVQVLLPNGRRPPRVEQGDVWWNAQ